MLIALTREVSPRISECELTFIDRAPIDFEKAVHQHRQYQQLLRNLGAEVVQLPADPQCPDSCFLEDTALVLDEIAILTRPGSDARRAEVGGVAPAVMTHRKTVRIAEPGTLEAGDVLRIGRNLFVGLTTRTNEQGIAMMRVALQPYGYKVIAVPIDGALHLKSICTALDDRTLLADTRRFDSSFFPGYEIVQVPTEEWAAANILRLNGAIGMHSGFPQTEKLVRTKGFDVRTVDISEFLKAEAGLTCLSIPFETAAR